MAPRLKPSFWKELRRRRVVRAISVYGVAAWVTVQVADVFFRALRLPEWAITLVAVIAVLGFPVTVALAWIFDRTPEGLQRTDEGDADEAAAEETPGFGRGSYLTRQFTAAVLLGVAVGVFVVGTGFWVTSRISDARTDPSAAASQVIAVLPFETIGNANPVFTEGIHGDVLTRLSGVADLDVISRSSVIRVQGENRSELEIASELGVGWILQGEVQQVTDQVQVNARLVDVRLDRQVWADAFRRELTAANLFDIQREITVRIVQALEDHLSPRQQVATRRAQTEDLEAYRLYVQGRSLLGPRQELPMRQAVDYFQRALERDPEYAAAWAGLADALTYLETFGFVTPAAVVDAERAAERALELDPASAEAHFALSNLAHAQRDNQEAIRRAERAIELRPSYSDAYNLLSWMHKLHGQTEIGLETAQRAVALDPLGSAPMSNLILAHLAMGDFERARQEARNLGELHPEFSTGTFLEALALYHQGRLAEARPLLQGLSVAWAGSGPAATLALVEMALGDTIGARETLAGIDDEAHPFSGALVRAALAESPEPLEPFTRVPQWDYWPSLAVHYFFPEVLGSLRRDARYQEILEQIDRSWGL